VILLLIVLVLVLAAPAEAAPSKPARNFVNSIGVNTHINYGNGVYEPDTARVGRLLKKIGIRHIRDGYALYQPWFNQRYEMLDDTYGVKAQIILDPRGGSVSDRIRELGEVGAEYVEGLEGPNEPNTAENFMDYPACMGSQWVHWVIQTMDEIKAGREKYFPGVPVVGPSPTNWQAYWCLADAGLASHEELGNVHPYPGGYRPGHPGVFDWHEQATIFHVHNGPFPYEVTETGYPTAERSPWHQGVTEDIAAAYAVPLFLEAFSRGVKRTYWYELIDQWYEPTGYYPESHFGLAYWKSSDSGGNFSLKPAGQTIANAIAILNEGGTYSGGPNSLDYQAPGVRSVLLRRSDGRYVIALWQDVDLQDTQERRPVWPPPLPVETKVTLPRDMQVEVYEPRKGPQSEYKCHGSTYHSYVNSSGPTFIVVGDLKPQTLPC
jgi:hypothetical protein